MPDPVATRASDDLLSVGEVSRRTGVPVSALHFYEREGLITSERTSGNQRRYARHMLRRVSLIVVAKRLGIPLGELAEVFATVPADRPPTVAEWRRMSRAWRAQLEERRRTIENLERDLAGCIGCGCLSLRACTLLNPDDVLGEQGAGPVRLTADAAPRTGRAATRTPALPAADA
ncbi:redox-sensitive transcriptional activator SoxR [Cellulomonas triticagri]|uniref:Redox-sensitive transcriptional activator SoxR n=1 Tax=Cellulomonas triticagri TaxID=2483352 RepID=A0A3M2JB79_9CELL|nr:redox-sensitive transcriptional activator SoxR [Cellulomonas triticagri]RMI09466.1 redox-sensitive transcriptional activator SoxR [Cellulomonas triticagri]